MKSGPALQTFLRAGARQRARLHVEESRAGGHGEADTRWLSVSVVTALSTESTCSCLSLSSLWFESFESDLLLLNKNIITSSNAFRIFPQVSSSLSVTSRGLKSLLLMTDSGFINIVTSGLFFVRG